MGDVRGAAKGQLSLADADDRHRSLGRDALDVTPQIHVEHRVADDGDSLSPRRFQKLDQSFPRNPLDHRMQAKVASPKA